MSVDFIKIIEIISFITTVIGVVLTSIPKISGLIILIVSSIFWGIFSYLNREYFFFITQIFLIGVNIFGYYNWKKKGIGI